MRVARKLMIVLFVAALAAPMMGCSVGASVADNRRTLNRVIDYDTRMLVDDLALFAQTRRTLRTSRWVID